MRQDDPPRETVEQMSARLRRIGDGARDADIWPYPGRKAVEDDKRRAGVPNMDHIATKRFLEGI